jgi:type VI secretion system secreted protein Hcp
VQERFPIRISFLKCELRFVDPLKRDEGEKMSRLLAGSRAAVFGVASMIFAALPFGASAADKIVLTLQGISGSSTLAGHLNWMDILSFSFGANAATSVGTTGASAGKVAVSTIQVMKVADRADVPLLRSLLTGARIATGTLDIVGPSTQETVARINLTNARVTSLQTSGSNETPVVSVSIAFEKIQLINNQYNPATGAVSGSESVTWDVLKNAVSTP